MPLTDSQLTTEANVIKNETTADANTATRVGTMLNDIIDNKINNDKISTSTSLGASNTLIPSQNAVKTYVDNNIGGILNIVKVSLSSAELLQIGTTPKVVVPKQGAGTIIRPISVNAVVNFNTTAYATNQGLTLYEGAWLPLLNMSNILSASATTYFNYPSLTTISTSSNVVNEDLVVYGASGNPTGGDSTLDLYVSYIVITL